MIVGGVGALPAIDVAVPVAEQPPKPVTVTLSCTCAAVAWNDAELCPSGDWSNVPPVIDQTMLW